MHACRQRKQVQLEKPAEVHYALTAHRTDRLDLLLSTEKTRPARSQDNCCRWQFCPTSFCAVIEGLGLSAPPPNKNEPHGNAEMNQTETHQRHHPPPLATTMCACSKTTLAHVRSTAMCQVPERHQGPPLRRILGRALPPISEVVAVCTGLCTHQA